ncbi:MAG: diguanylate cyclase [Actinomycetales bacterium]
MRGRLSLAVTAAVIAPLVAAFGVLGLVDVGLLGADTREAYQRNSGWVLLLAFVIGVVVAAIVGLVVAGRLAEFVSALDRQRDVTRGTLDRLADTLRLTHDLEGLLRVATEAVTTSVQAPLGAAYLVTPSGELSLVGTAGSSNAAVRLPSVIPREHPPLGALLDAPELLQATVDAGTVTEASGRGERWDLLAAPLLRTGSVVGLLVLIDPSRSGALLGNDPADRLLGVAAQAEVAVENVMAYREAQRLAITDPLTGLWNYRYLSMSLGREIVRASRFRRPLAVLMLDVDLFKKVNDTYGHARGDAVLRELAHRLAEQVREVDVLARYGGEEFTVVLPETDRGGAEKLARRILEAVRNLPFSDGGPPLQVTVSIGVAIYPQHGQSPAVLLRAADEALYLAKAQGRDQAAIAAV